MNAPRLLVQLDEDALRALVAEAVAEGLAARQPSRLEVPALITRRALAEALHLSLAALDRLRREPGFPELRAGSVPRFDLQQVREYLATRGTP